MSTRRKKREFSQEFRFRAVQRMLAGESPTLLARELEVLRKTLYEWKDHFVEKGLPGLAGQAGQRLQNTQPAAPRVPSELQARGELLRARARIEELERKVGKQELELDFFDAALRRIRALGVKNRDKNSASSLPIDPSKAS